MLLLTADEGDDEEEDEDDDDDDQMLVGEEALDFLSTDFGMDDGDEDDEDGLGSTAMRHLAVQHTEEVHAVWCSVVQYSRVYVSTVQCRAMKRIFYNIRKSSLSFDVSRKET